MEMPLEQQKAPRASADQRTSDELASLIRKLRWMGMDAEAEPLMDELARRGAAGAVGVVAASRDTD